MVNITFIGAGSRGFGSNLLGDILSYPELADSTLTLMDVSRFTYRYDGPTRDESGQRTPYSS